MSEEKKVGSSSQTIEVMATEIQLTAARVKELVMKCLFDDAATITEDNSVKAAGILHTYVFNKKAVEKNTEEIKQLLSCLPEAFHAGGHSFLAACMDKDDRHWGEHVDIEGLVCLGLAAELVKYCAPRSFWTALPGGLPYFQVTS